MSAFKRSLHIASDASGQRLDLARELLESGEGVVLEHRIAIGKVADRFECAVITRFRQPADPNALQSEVEEAKQLLEASSLRPFVAGPISWIVIDDYGTGAIKVWPR